MTTPTPLASEPVRQSPPAAPDAAPLDHREVRTIAEEVEEKVKSASGPSPLRIEGLDDARWVLIDYGDFVVHVFLDEVRRFYDLERLWGDAPVWEWHNGENRVASGA